MVKRNLDSPNPTNPRPNKKTRFGNSFHQKRNNSTSTGTDPFNLDRPPIRLIFFNPPNPDHVKLPDTPKAPEQKCNNPKCDHKTSEENPEEWVTPDNVITRFKNIDDLINLGYYYHCKKYKTYKNINLYHVCNLISPLTQLKNMIGMKSVKKNIVQQIIYYLQGFNVETKCSICMNCLNDSPCVKNKNDMLHTIVTGPPGVGKTELGKILGKIYNAMGILSSDKFIIASRADLIGKYLGHTAVKTQEKINEASGGVLFIDEAYSLGNSEGRDSFSKECIDTINQNLTEKRDFICIIAGYKNSLEKNFFNYNEGLKRRFTFRYEIEKYSATELFEILKLKIKLDGWNYEQKDESKIVELFESNTTSFPNYGGDVETLYLKSKIYHSKRVLFLDESAKKNITYEDLKHGLKDLVTHRVSKKLATIQLWSK